MEVDSAGGKKDEQMNEGEVVILDFGSFTRSGLLVDRICPAETQGDKARKEQRVQDQKGGSRRQRDHQPYSDGKVIGSYIQLGCRRFQ